VVRGSELFMTMSLLMPPALLAPAASVAASVAATPQSPNVLVIIGDDHAPYVYGAYGYPLARTPNLDRLASAGVRFNRAYCNTPMCTQSRQSLLTGKLPHTIGVTRLRTALAARERTLAEMLAERGYTTRAIGKMHFNSKLTHGFERHIDAVEHRAYLKTLKRRPVPQGVEVLGPWRPFRDHARDWLNGFTRPFAAHDAEMESTFLAGEAVRFIEAKHDKPYLLFVSFREPHSPFRFPIEYVGRFDPDKMPARPVGPEDDGQLPAVFRDLTDGEKRGINAAYYTSVAFLDKNVGLELDALDRSGQAEQTLVVYLGDHGYSLGQHGRFEKHCFYEPAVRSPLVFRFPKRFKAGAVSEALVEFVDIVPTVLDVCGAPVPDGLRGQSLLDVLTGRRGDHRDYVFCEYYHYPGAMVRTDRYKYIYSTGTRERDDGYATGLPLPGRTRRLYDLVDDPDEMHNLADEPAHQARVAELEATMLEVFSQTTPTHNPPVPPTGWKGADLLDWHLVSRDD
jgi:choline-sulfatase